MFAEVAKPVTLVLCILSLYAVFNAATWLYQWICMKRSGNLSSGWHWQP
jgi:hypothetical protein